jgi:GNAT superfamily N-acetyltransferase
MTLVMDRLGAADTVARFTPADAADLLAMHDRCSDDTRYRRWHGHAHTFPPAYLDALVSGPPEHVAVVARRDGLLIGFASAAEAGLHCREIGVLVEDTWQRRGVGGQLLTQLLDECAELDSRYIRAGVLASDAALLAPLRALGPTTMQPSFDTVTATIRVRAS